MASVCPLKTTAGLSWAFRDRSRTVPATTVAAQKRDSRRMERWPRKAGTGGKGDCLARRRGRQCALGSASRVVQVERDHRFRSRLDLALQPGEPGVAVL